MIRTATLAAVAVTVLTVSPAQATPIAPVAVGAIGDSITYGWGTSTQTFGNGPVTNPNAYPSVAGVPAVGMPAQCLVATSCGIGDVPRWDGVPLVAMFGDELAALPSPVDVVVVEVGVNDLGQSVTDDAYEAAYTDLQAQGAAFGVDVVLSTITPRSAAHPLPAEQEAQRERVNAWIRSQPRFVDYAAALGGDVMDPGFDPGDGLHPDDAGAAAMGRVLAAWVAAAQPPAGPFPVPGPVPVPPTVPAPQAPAPAPVIRRTHEGRHHVHTVCRKACHR